MEKYHVKRMMKRMNIVPEYFFISNILLFADRILFTEGFLKSVTAVF